MFNLVLVTVGLALFGRSVWRLVGLLKLMGDRTLRKWWVVLLGLILIFCIGYLLFAYFLVTGSSYLTGKIMPTLVSLIFFFGAIFVVVTIGLIFSTVSAVGKRSVQLKEANKQLDEAKRVFESEVKARTEEIEKSKKALEKEIGLRTAELELKVKELESTNKLMVDRELKMVEMKRELDALRKQVEFS